MKYPFIIAFHFLIFYQSIAQAPDIKQLEDSLLIAYDLISNNKIDGAYKILNHVENRNKKLKDAGLEALLYNVEGILNVNIGNLGAALKLYSKALTAYEKSNNYLRSRVVKGNIAQINSILGSYKENDSVFIENIKIFKAYKYNRLFYSYRSLIESLFVQKRYHDVIVHSNEAINDFNTFDFSSGDETVNTNIKDRVINIIEMYKAFSLFELEQDLEEANTIINRVSFIINDSFIWNDVVDHSNIYRYKTLYFGTFNKNNDSLKYYIKKSIWASNLRAKQIDSVKIRIRNHAYQIAKKEDEFIKISLIHENEKKIHAKSSIILWLSISAIVVIVLLFISRQASFTKQKKLTKLLIEKNEKLITRDKDRLKFFSIISHELRTPVHGLYGLTQLLLKEKNKKRKKDYARNINYSANHLNILINNILNYSRFNLEKIKSQPDEVEIKDFLEKTIQSFTHLASENNNRICLDFDNRLPEIVIVDKSILLQILINLITNAIKFTENGTVTVKAKLIDENADKITLKLAVNDSGIGIQPELQKDIFKVYVTDTKNKNAGTGLGLYITKELTKVLNSKIKLKSKIGQGSEFYFNLNIKSKKACVLEHLKNPAETSILKNKHVLVVDDNNINLLVAINLLKKESALCDSATNGVEAIKKVKENSYDLILMDLNMPVLDGYGAAKEIRKINPNIPIVALTALEQNEVYEKAILSGMNNVQLKPLNLQELIINIEKLFKSSKYDIA